MKPEQIVDAIEESMFDCYPQWRELTPSDLPIVAERIANALANTEPEDELAWQPVPGHPTAKMIALDKILTAQERERKLTTCPYCLTVYDIYTADKDDNE